MAALTSEKEKLEAQLSEPLAPAELAKSGKRLKLVTDELASLEERWMALSGEIEALETAR